MDKAVEALGLNLPQLIAQVVNFFVLLFVLRLVAYKPILKMLDERKQKIAEGLNAAEIARAEAASAQANIQAQLDTARKEGQEIVAGAQGIATRIQADAREQSAKDRDAALERARIEIQQERDRAISDLRGEFADITVKAAEKVINQSLDRQSHQRVIDETLAESNFSGN
ncbi:MAG: F0F1 ATP synthase subunit B [Dehalococcoidia bacterium]|jgi:F-type H+-transporting ATPase subunit b|uniref:F0F1 ATP synthase subunit B n=1 Tax=Candidatus Amarobacter glycogenicus TaxID=3140699 RepID=UPI001DF35646|nr:F0F1 ATP synthase subunit B [Dehalococcoidia bacterium]MBK6561796.1 F0F1 ATP synthase subunit B [Dehalococcoidia bacterium]MBK7126883.1 F0F1 ATP synthase subunit B [Dehalococcoidia bacterium]MBK7330403.1 F0F1 ATP synthase subunit B [Dehalococcoidia bacterium]MBK7724478.1 F0F1 ATP synthase subunit B [Dehalococcoidia bacterium]